MMEDAGIPVGEIVSTYDNTHDVNYTYIMTSIKIREERLEEAMEILDSSYNIKGSDNPEHKVIISNSTKLMQNIEDQPGFRMLIAHEACQNVNFHRWANANNNIKGKYGFSRLKHKLGLGVVTTSASGIYVLRLDNRPTPFFYVGKATNITQRIQQHKDCTGAVCIAGEPFTRVEPVTKGSTSRLFSLL
jgi:hypothetical protein